MGVLKNANLMLEGQKLKFGEIAIFILKLSSKAQIRLSTIKMVGLLLEFSISVRFHPPPDAIFHTEAHSVSTVLLGDQKR
jgi:hypothetical protein